MLVDAFTYCGEEQTLLMRLALHTPFVDQFWIVESDHTFSGKPKEWTFEQNRHKFAPWLDKIHFIPFRAPVAGMDFSKKDEAFNFESPAWLLENAQRNALGACLASMDDDDVALVSDLDEFIAPEVLQTARTSTHDVARLSLLNHYYYMNCRAVGSNAMWNFPLVVKVKWWRERPEISQFRPFGDASHFISNAGWHFSYLGGPDAISKKISSFSHTEFDRPDINNSQHLADSIANGKDCFGRAGHEYAFYPVHTYPPVIQNLMRQNGNFVRWTLY